MARVSVRSGLTRYRSLRTLLTSTGGSSNRVLDGARQASLYSRSAMSNAIVDAMFIEPSAHYASSSQAKLHGYRHGARTKQSSISTSSELALLPITGSGS